MTRRALSHICKLLTLLAAGTATVSAQGDPSLVSDQVLGGTGGQIERVELSNGGVNLSIPLVRVKGRGKDFTFRLNYSSKSLYPGPHWFKQLGHEVPMEILDSHDVQEPRRFVVPHVSVHKRDRKSVV